jgi:hypothetical protein
MRRVRGDVQDIFCPLLYHFSRCSRQDCGRTGDLVCPFPVFRLNWVPARDACNQMLSRGL